MKDLEADPKLKQILEAAWQAFAAYGFRKTSMDDIARSAGMSRPALYLRFKNKEDIFRSLVQHYYDQAVQDVEQALYTDGSVPARIAAAFAAQGGQGTEAMLTSPHGMELLGTGHAIASDIFETGEARIGAVYAAWLDREVTAGRVALSGTAQDTAATMTSALKGIKTTVPDYPVYCARVEQLAALIGAGLVAPK